MMQGSKLHQKISCGINGRRSKIFCNSTNTYLSTGSDLWQGLAVIKETITQTEFPLEDKRNQTYHRTTTGAIFMPYNKIGSYPRKLNNVGGSKIFDVEIDKCDLWCGSITQKGLWNGNSPSVLAISKKYF